MMNISAATSSSLNTSATEDLPSKVKGIIWCGVFAMESLFLVVGNLLTIVLFATSRKLRKRSLIIAMNMAFADAMIGIVCLPLNIYVNIGGVYYQLWTPDTSLDIIFDITQTVFGQASLISAAVISGERFYAIYWPLKHQILPVRAYYIVISIVWVLSIIVTTVFLSLTLFKSKDHAFYTLMPCYLILLLIVCFSNCGIWRKFQLRGNILRQRRGTLNRRLTTTLLFVSTVALLSWLPSIIIMVSRIRVPSYVNVFEFLLLYFNSLVNPIVYTLRITEFRQALILCCLRRKSKLNGQKNRWSDRSTQRWIDRKSQYMSAPLVNSTQLKTLTPRTCHLQLAPENCAIRETKL